MREALTQPKATLTSKHYLNRSERLGYGAQSQPQKEIKAYPHMLAWLSLFDLPDALSFNLTYNTKVKTTFRTSIEEQELV
jgi:hypothetical protein